MTCYYQNSQFLIELNAWYSTLSHKVIMCHLLKQHKAVALGRPLRSPAPRPGTRLCQHPKPGGLDEPEPLVGKWEAQDQHGEVCMWLGGKETGRDAVTPAFRADPFLPPEALLSLQGRARPSLKQKGKGEITARVRGSQLSWV